MKTIAGLFDDLAAAQAAVQDLRALGLTGSDVNLVAHDPTGAYARSLDATPASDATATGAGMGAVLGGLAGMVVGLGALVLPGIGPVLAAGPLATVLAGIVGAGVGAVGGGVAGGLIGALIDAGVPEDQAHAYAEGLRRGGVLVTAQIADDQERPVRAILTRHPAVDIEQRAQAWRTQGWTGHNPTARPYTRDEIDEERRAFGLAQAPAMDAEDYYRQHYAGAYGGTGRDFDAYRPAYAYGQSLSTDPRYAAWEWDRLEPEAQRDWEARYPHQQWADFKAAVRIAWESVKATIR